jgi:hypothetical protein
VRSFPAAAAVFAIAVASSGCASSLARATSSRYYHEARYLRVCVKGGVADSSSSCRTYGTTVNELMEEVKASQKAADHGPLPGLAKRELKRLVAKIEKVAQ